MGTYFSKGPASVRAKCHVYLCTRRLLRERGGNLSVAQRGSRMGDTLIIDFDVSEQETGKPIEGMERERHELDCIAENNFLPGVMPQMIGMQVGEIKNFDFVFPDPWEPEQFAGLAARVGFLSRPCSLRCMLMSHTRNAPESTV